MFLYTLGSCSQITKLKLESVQRQASQVVLVVKNLPANTENMETWVQSLGWEDPLEKEQQSTPVFLPEKSHGQRSLAGYRKRGCKASGTTGAS